ncbi:unnamed protein product [Mycena citricolor]|uniref:Uncharacterized protein n=1 Tax=Mycena citricolor TaxID=2018698 RepID=A0AAD2HFJ8_9AGAR|nr:unnamed protein product [Mycena citricolor]
MSRRTFPEDSHSRDLNVGPFSTKFELESFFVIRKAVKKLNETQQLTRDSRFASVHPFCPSVIGIYPNQVADIETPQWSQLQSGLRTRCNSPQEPMKLFQPRSSESESSRTASSIALPVPRTRILTFRTPSGGSSTSTQPDTIGEVLHTPNSNASPRKTALKGTAPGPVARDTASDSQLSSEPGIQRANLGIADAASLFLRMRPRQVKKPHHIESSSGLQPLSHSQVVEGAQDAWRSTVRRADVFICEGGVNVVQLLRVAREDLLEDAGVMGGNALVDERWDCTICGPKHRRNGFFKVEIAYSASAMRSSTSDPHRPVAVAQARGVPGLMSVIKRNV